MLQVFYIHNTTRSPHTRDLRRAVNGPESSTKNLFIGGAIRVVRGRPHAATESFIRRHIIELLDKEKKGLIQVFSMNSQRVDISTLQVLPDAPPPPESEPEVEEPQESAVSVPVLAPTEASGTVAPIEELSVTEQAQEETTDNPFMGRRRGRR